MGQLGCASHSKSALVTGKGNTHEEEEKKNERNVDRNGHDFYYKTTIYESFFKLYDKMNTYVYVIAAAVIVVFVVVYYARIRETFLTMPAGYVTAALQRQAMSGGPGRYLKATNIPPNWTGFLENRDGTIYERKTSDPFEVVHPTALVEAIVDKENKFHCFYNTNAKGYRGHLSVQLPRDRACRLGPGGASIQCDGPGQASGMLAKNLLQPPWAYNPADHTSEVHCPNTTSFQFSPVM
jgi:hypothetical protein